eukprot:CAMPEP_0206232872 /NCGR_PEP_ID=MMETSP0047_2-20121206/11660_1 /ASSEMBLY_ACC=CAM_ASM_000192 /TAXON_ID=195065 /ORGANISM="Chroomonas mesostigmatica_cf, Strain CCMP1168" /LENGTH=87 /DNA_ID=CAMNT_0053656663 /DNA_START=83 /DNA_END=342 /DNA_ORIENTATION=+
MAPQRPSQQTTSSSRDLVSDTLDRRATPLRCMLPSTTTSLPFEHVEGGLVRYGRVMAAQATSTMPGQLPRPCPRSRAEENNVLIKEP